MRASARKRQKSPIGIGLIFVIKQKSALLTEIFIFGESEKIFFTSTKMSAAKVLFEVKILPLTKNESCNYVNPIPIGLF